MNGTDGYTVTISAREFGLIMGALGSAERAAILYGGDDSDARAIAALRRDLPAQIKAGARQ